MRSTRRGALYGPVQAPKREPLPGVRVGRRVAPSRPSRADNPCARMGFGSGRRSAGIHMVTPARSDALGLGAEQRLSVRRTGILRNRSRSRGFCWLPNHRSHSSSVYCDPRTLGVGRQTVVRRRVPETRSTQRDQDAGNDPRSSCPRRHRSIPCLRCGNRPPSRYRSERARDSASTAARSEPRIALS